MQPDAYCFKGRFDVAGPSQFKMDRHYLLYAMHGTMRLEAQDRRWTLPPARAALIAADEPILITILSNLSTASVLFKPGFIGGPSHPVSVFEVSPLVRELILECRQWNQDCVLDSYALRIFSALGEAAFRSAAAPNRNFIPRPKGKSLLRAVELTEMLAAGEPSFEEIAKQIGMAPRTLARQFASEMGMTWRDLLRRTRLIRAVEELATTDKKVTAVALDVGYQSLSAFNAAFRDFTGKTPAEYRSSFRG